MPLRWLVAGFLAIALATGGGASAIALLSGGSDNTAGAPAPTAAPTTVAQPTNPPTWPEPDLRQQLIDKALEYRPASDRLTGHRYRVLTVNPYFEETSSCSDPERDLCAEVGIYDYTGATGITVIVDVEAMKAVGHAAVPEFTGQVTADELDEAFSIARTSLETPGLQLDKGFYHLIDDTDHGGQCGTANPLHRCLELVVRYPDGTPGNVVVDMVDQTAYAADWQ